MAQYQGRVSKLDKRKKKKSERGSDPVHPKRGDEDKRKKVRMKGGQEKTIAEKVKSANVSVKGKTQKVAITAVDENPANKDYKRENVVSLGGLIDTDLGKAKVTSRPSQDGVVNAVLV